MAPSVPRRLSHAFFSLLFPDECRLCHRALDGFTRVPVCGNCLRAPAPFAAEFYCRLCKTPFLNRFPLDEDGRCGLCRAGVRGFEAAYCWGAYDGPLRELIHLFKYGGMKPLAKPLAEYLWRAVPVDDRFDAVTPMPLHWRRRWSRGFNQAELLARQVSRRLGVPLLGAVRRTRNTPTQTGLTSAQRRDNMSGAFRPYLRNPVRGLRVLLVDDVMTTGATAAACAHALKRAGARSVTLLTLARADRALAAPSQPDGGAA